MFENGAPARVARGRQANSPRVTRPLCTPPSATVARAFGPRGRGAAGVLRGARQAGSDDEPGERRACRGERILRISTAIRGLR
jgi:hypothetical protein